MQNFRPRRLRRLRIRRPLKFAFYLFSLRLKLFLLVLLKFTSKGKGDHGRTGPLRPSHTLPSRRDARPSLPPHARTPVACRLPRRLLDPALRPQRPPPPTAVKRDTTSLGRKVSRPYAYKGPSLLSQTARRASSLALRHLRPCCTFAASSNANKALRPGPSPLGRYMASTLAARLVS